jgi:hypothetical protein
LKFISKRLKIKVRFAKQKTFSCDLKTRSRDESARIPAE